MRKDMKWYAGIGSRRTPEPVLSEMFDIGFQLSERGWGFRSGGADGADTAFEQGHTSVAECVKEIFLPWKGFNGHKSDLYEISLDAYELAEETHPAWEHLKSGGRKCIARNVHQILGKNLNSPVDITICYCEDENKGGTAFAIKVAKDRTIPVFNLYFEEQREELYESLGLKRTAA